MQRILIADAEFDVLCFPAWKGSGTEKCLFRGTVTILDLLLHLPVPVFKGVYTFLSLPAAQPSIYWCVQVFPLLHHGQSYDEPY